MNITAVIVFYNQGIEESKTFRSLKKTMLTGSNSSDIQFVLYDNSQHKQELPKSITGDPNISYIHDPRNLGIATAYNYALAAARKSNSDWLILLDHDTELTQEYIDELIQLDSMETDVAAVVPRITSMGKVISPVFSNSMRPLQQKKPENGLQNTPVMAINSGAAIRISFLNEVGGFNEEFPLDYLDHWLFYVIYERDRKVWLMDSTLEHELSVLDYSNVSIKRYKSILDSEMRFYQKYKTEFYQSFKVQLAKRLFKQLLLVKNKQIAFYTFSKLISK